MTRQEKIREGVWMWLLQMITRNRGGEKIGGEQLDALFQFLASEGVVLKTGYTIKYSTSIPAGTELVAVEPLIEEEK